MSVFNKKVGKHITHDEADKLKDNWAKKGGHKTNSSFFGSDIIQNLIADTTVIGIRIHYGLDGDGNVTPVLTAERDTISAEAATKESDGPVNASLPCPPVCP